MVTITGTLASLAAAGFGVAGIQGATLELAIMHPSEQIRPAYGFSSALAAGRPLIVALSTGGAIPTGTEILETSAWTPAGCFHRATWVAPSATGGEAERIVYDLLIGPVGGTCNITNPALRLGAGMAPVLAGWPPLPPVVVYSSEGTP